MEENFLKIAKENTYCPDELRMNINTKVDEIRTEYDQKFMEVVKWFWKEVDKQTSNEEKAILFNHPSHGFLREYIRKDFNK